jgi:ribosomal protein S18 acetylase RimI-like enzyme
MPKAVRLHVAAADASDVDELADVAALTFPLACPPSATPQNIMGFIDANLSSKSFAEYLADPDRVVLAAYDGGRIVGYCMLIRSAPHDPDVQKAVKTLPAVELSKMYVLPESHGVGVSAALMTAALDHASKLGAKSVWLGVNEENRRAQRFYAKHGFKINGTKTFRLGDGIEHDYVMLRSL